MAEAKGFKDRLTGTTYDLKDSTAREGVVANAEAIAALAETVPVVDDDLETAGAAADAKKTGDELSELKRALNYVYVPDDLTWTIGTLTPGTGAESSGASRIRSPYISVNAGDKITLLSTFPDCLLAYCFAQDKSYLYDTLWSIGNSYTVPDNINGTKVGYVRLLIRKSGSNPTIDSSEIDGLVAQCTINRVIPNCVYSMDLTLNEINNNIISKSIKFDVAAGSAHSSAIDKLNFNIAAGESYGVFIKSNITRSVELYEYLGTTGTSRGNVKTNKFLKITSESGAEAISLYISAGDSDASFTLIAYKGDSIDGVLADNVQAIAQMDLKAYTTQFTVAAGSTHSSLNDRINIPIAEGEYINCVATGLNGRNSIVYLISNGTATQSVSIADGFIRRFKAPIDADGIGLFTGPGSEAAAITFTVFSENSALASLAERTEKDNQYLVKLMNAKRKANAGNYNALTSPEIFTIAHFSDIHGNEWAMKQVQEFKDAYQAQLDDVICTGDVVTDKISDGTAFWNNNSDGEILICIGNHDSLGNNGWANPVDQQTLYETYIEPYEANWGAETVDGHSYWYKDYSDKKIRLIAIDATIYDATEQANQMTWLNTALSGAITNGYAVVGAIHFPPMAANFQKIDSNFTALLHGTGSDMSAFAWSTYNTDILEAIDQFIDDGGDFVCWLSGHTHYDLVSYDNRFPKQLFVTISCAMPSSAMEEKIRDEKRGSGFVLNTVCVDTVRKYVKLLRYGAEWDDCLRHTGTCVIKYDANPPTVMFSN